MVAIWRLAPRWIPICAVLCLSLITSPATLAQTHPDLTVAFVQGAHHGGRIYVTDFSGDPILVTPSAPPTYEMMPEWSPDGTQIAFLASESYIKMNEAHLYIITLATHEMRQVSDLKFTSETELAWSPDGRFVAATTGTIVIVNIETGTYQELPKSSIRCGTCYVSWLADSSGIVFRGRYGIARINVDGQSLQQITSFTSNQPALSPVSEDVAFFADYEKVFGLYKVNLNDLVIHRMAVLPDYEAIPLYWSPDGQHIAFGVYPGFHSNVDVPGGGDIDVVNADGTDMRTITGDKQDNLIGWTNDSQFIIDHMLETNGIDGSYFAVNITDLSMTRLSNQTMDKMCSNGSCQNFVIRPTQPMKAGASG